MNDKDIETSFRTLTFSMEDDPSILTADTSLFAVDLFDWELNGVMGLHESVILVTSKVF